MDRIRARKLKPWERKQLQYMKRQLANAVNRLHARIILLSGGGNRNSRIADACGCSPTWVRQILYRFNRGGVKAIAWYPAFCGPAGPRKFFADSIESICEIALSPPKQLVGMTVWSLAKLREYLIAQKIIVSISLETLRQILRNGKIRWRHTQTWKDSDDPEFWSKYRRLKRLYAKRPSGGHRISIDEFGPLNLLPRHGRHYARIGHTDRLRATYDRHGGVRHMFGAYDLERNTLVGTFASKKNWTTFLAFLKWLRQRYPRKETLYLILDNATYHHKAEVLTYAKTHNLRLYWTPTNASWLNRIECHFTALKKFALDNTDYRSHPEQEAAIEHYLAWRNRQRPISLQDWKTYRRHKHAA